MTLFEVEELCAYWAEHPPTHLAVSRPRPPQKRSMETVLAELGPGIAAGDVGAGLPPVVLGFEALRRAVAMPPDPA